MIAKVVEEYEEIISDISDGSVCNSNLENTLFSSASERKRTGKQRRRKCTGMALATAAHFSLRLPFLSRFILGLRCVCIAVCLSLCDNE